MEYMILVKNLVHGNSLRKNLNLNIGGLAGIIVVENA